MFRISPINDKNLQAEYAALCGVELISDYFAYSMTDVETGELMGFSQFEILGSYGYIATLVPRKNYSDFEAMFILGRATMNFIDMCGAHLCRAAKDAADESLLRAIGFKESDDGELVADMTGMFDGHCGGSCEE